MEHKFIHGFSAPFHSETNFLFGELTTYSKQQKKTQKIKLNLLTCRQILPTEKQNNPMVKLWSKIETQTPVVFENGVEFLSTIDRPTQT